LWSEQQQQFLVGHSAGAPAQLLARTLATLRRLADATSSWQGAATAQGLQALLQELTAEVAKAQQAAGDGGTASAGR
jgi:hypothetical protein